ncbi:MAG: hypothetical protein PVG03_09135 [Desulfarculaceae bacterium]|jgi:hypothetical protein
MGEVKSSLEIALERAEAMSSGDKGEEEREQGRRKGQIIARKVLAGDLDPKQGAGEISALSGAERQGAAQTMVEHLMAKLQEQAPLAFPALAELLDAAAVQKLEQVLAEMTSAGDGELAKLGDELGKEFAALGLSGSALRPNPLSHPQAEARLKAVLSPVAGRLQEAKAEVLRSLAPDAG